jgi:hypothetical protein
VYHGLRYRFEVVISELKTAESDVLRSTLLAFVNCLVFGCEDLHQRDRIRNEFLGMLVWYHYQNLVFSDLNIEQACATRQGPICEKDKQFWARTSSVVTVVRSWEGRGGGHDDWVIF